MRRLVLGIPTWNERQTIEQTLRTVDAGAALLPADVDVLLVNADNSSLDGTPEVFAGAATRHRKLVIDTGPARGKGRNVLAILRQAWAWKAHVLLFDADVRSLEPRWVPALAAPLLEERAALVTPLYARNRFEGNTTNHVVFPLLFALFGRVLRQPIAGEFGLSRGLIEDVLARPVPASAEQYGIDIFLTTTALLAGLPSCEVALGRKIHNPGFPKIVDMSRQVVHSLLASLADGGFFTAHRPWPPAFPNDLLAALETAPTSVDARLSPPDAERVRHTAAVTRALLREHRQRCRELMRYAGGEMGDDESAPLPTFSAETWPRVLAALVRSAVRGDDPRELSEAFVPLYLCRVFSYWPEIQPLTAEEIDRLLVSQATRLQAELARLPGW